MESRERRNAVARAVLLWLLNKGDDNPLVEGFLTRPAATVGEEQVGNDELIRTVRWLDDRLLLGGLRIEKVPYPIRPTLTDEGRRVTLDQDGWVEPDAAPVLADMRERFPSKPFGFWKDAPDAFSKVRAFLNQGRTQVANLPSVPFD